MKLPQVLLHSPVPTRETGILRSLTANLMSLGLLQQPHGPANGLSHEKLTALRQCVEKIEINKPAGEATLAIRTVLVDSLQATQEFRISI